VDDAKVLATQSCNDLTGIEYKPFECHGQDARVPEVVRAGLPGWFPDRLMNSVYASMNSVSTGVMQFHSQKRPDEKSGDHMLPVLPPISNGVGPFNNRPTGCKCECVYPLPGESLSAEYDWGEGIPVVCDCLGHLVKE
jgi:hypothetical protein